MPVTVDHGVLCGKFLDVPKANGLWLVLLAAWIIVVGFFVRRVNVRKGRGTMAFGRLWGAIVLVPLLLVGGVVILIVGH